MKEYAERFNAEADAQADSLLQKAIKSELTWAMVAGATTPFLAVPDAVCRGQGSVLLAI